MEIIKKNYKYLLLFIFFISVLIFFGFNNMDNIWNYGFSHAIRIGEVPYKDFNIISTPLFSFIMSLGLFIYDSYIVFVLEQALLCTLLFCFLEKMFSKNSTLVLAFFSFPIFYSLFPNYNFLVLLLMTILLFLENNNKESEYLIGFVLGLLILSKHTIGIMILICSLISCFDKKKIIKRICSSFIPILFFVIYLFLTNSMNSFINLSILGLFDFNKNNFSISFIYIIILLAIGIHLLVMFKKDINNRNNYYLLSSFAFVIPICDSFHLCYLIIIYVMVILLNYNIKPSNTIMYVSVLIVFLTIILNIIVNYKVYKRIDLCKLNHFEGFIIVKDNRDFLDDINRQYRSGNNNFMFSFSNMFFDIASDHKITYYDVPLNGNYGYKGMDMMKTKIDSLHNIYFYIEDNKNVQYARKIYKYIKEKGDKKATIYNYEVYYIK